MNLKLIACRVFEPEINAILSCTDRRASAAGSDIINVDWLPLSEHNHPDTLRRAIQERIDAADAADDAAKAGREAAEDTGESFNYDAIILAYGLCGNALSDIQARSIPLYIPRAHDCSQILLGSADAHAMRFADTPSRGWTSRGYMASEEDPFRVGDEISGWDLEALIAQYGEENGRYAWEAMHASDSADDAILYFLDVPETSEPAVLKRAEDQAVKRNKTLQLIPATLDLLERLLTGRGGEEILYIAPGGSIRPTYGDDVIAASQAEAKDVTVAE